MPLRVSSVHAVNKTSEQVNHDDVESMDRKLNSVLNVLDGLQHDIAKYKKHEIRKEEKISVMDYIYSFWTLFICCGVPFILIETFSRESLSTD